MAETLERSRNKEQSPAVHFDTTLIEVSEHLTADSLLSLREIEQGEESPNPIYICTPKDESLASFYDRIENMAQNLMDHTASLESPEHIADIQAQDIDEAYKTVNMLYKHGFARDQDIPRPAFCSFNERSELIWSANDNEASIGIVLAHQDGSIDWLGAGKDAEQYGVTSLSAGDRVFMIPNDVIDGMKDKNLFSLDGLSRIEADPDLSTNLVSIAFDEAITERATEVPKKKNGYNGAVDRSAEYRQQQIRKKLGLPMDASEAQVREARKAARSNRPSKKSPATENEESFDDTLASVDIMQAFADDEELQAQITDATRFQSASREPGFTVVNKRVRSRKELLYASLDQLPGDSQATEPSPEVTGPVVPPKPDYDPTVHLNTTMNTEPQAEVTPTVERMSWKEKLRHPLAYLASQMDSYRVIHQNKLEEKYSGEELAERNKDQETALKVILGATAGALIFVTAWKLGQDMASAQNIGIADGEWATGSPKTPAPEPTPVPAPRFEFSADASTVTRGEGWYQTIQETTGVTDQTQQAAILQKIGPVLQEKGWAYIMPDGKWGISRPGTLPKDVLELIKNSR